MGLNDNTRRLANTLEEKNQEKKRKELEKMRKESQKKNLERVKAETIQYLTSIFQEAFTKYGSSYEIEFLNIDRKAEILKQCKSEIIGETTNDLNNKNFNIEESKHFFETFNKNYYKILKEQKTIFLNNEKYLLYKTQQEAEQQETPNEPKQVDAWQIITKIISIFFKILFVIFGGLLFLVGCALKSVK